MITADEARALVGKRVVLTLDPASGEREAAGLCVGKVESADGLVLVLEPKAQPGGRRTYHYQHVTAARAE